jgi:AcrR family transcriptional regulator
LCHVGYPACVAAGHSGVADVPRTLSEEDIAEFREQLCAAASRLFAQRGTDGVTMRALAEIMGISPMKPYHYFRDKEEILAAAMERAFNRFVAALEAAENTAAPALERANARRQAYVAFALAEPDCYRVMFELPHPDTAKYPGLQAAMDRARAVTRRGMDALIASGLIEGDPVVLGNVFWCALHGAVSAYIAGKLDSREQLEAILDISMKSLREGLKPAAR